MYHMNDGMRKYYLLHADYSVGTIIEKNNVPTIEVYGCIIYYI